MKLLDLEGDQLGIPDTEYKSVVKLPASEFQRICRDLTMMGDTVVVSVTKEGIKFSVNGENGGSNISLRPSNDVDSKVR